MTASDSEDSRTPDAARSTKSRALTVLLQCLPLLFAGGCIASTFGPAGWYLESPGEWIITILGLSVLAWGLGYVYLRRYRRFVSAICSAVVFAVFAWWLNLVLLDGCIDLGTSLDCPQRVRVFDRPFALLTAALVVVWVVVYARDALKLVATLNRGASEETSGNWSVFGRVALTSAVIGIAVLGFYLTPACSRIWNSTR